MWIFPGIKFRVGSFAITILKLFTELKLIKKKSEIITDNFISTVCDRLSQNKQVRRSLPRWGRIHIDRQLPFLCVYRRPQQHNNIMTERLIMGEASYLIANSNRMHQKQLSKLVINVADTLNKVFGSFIIIEIWNTNELNSHDNLNEKYKPIFNIVKPNKTPIK